MTKKQKLPKITLTFIKLIVFFFYDIDNNNLILFGFFDQLCAL